MLTRTPKVILLQVLRPEFTQEDLEMQMAEATSLVSTYGGTVVGVLTQQRENPHPGTYIGGGKIEELSRIVKEQHVDVVVINDVVRSGQLFRLEQALWPVNTRIIVWDRVGIILAIFDQHAKTREAKLQIELARIKHIGPRVYGLGGTVLSKQAGGIGTRGKGETNIEYEKRHIRRRVLQIEKEIRQRETMQQTRMNDRKKRGLSTAALVGYTSAGKTSLFNALTGRHKEEHAKLFTTLDSVVGRIRYPHPLRDVLLSDTIGFIDGLPPQLIAAFRSTLMESIEADLLLHVLDASDPDREKKRLVVEDILAALPAKQPVLLVCTKIDKLSEDELEKLKEDFLGIPTVFVSTMSGDGLKDLRSRIIQNVVE